jgi:uncharacterized metal-binding protein
MQIGARRELGIDGPCDRCAREALVRVGVVAHERLVAEGLVRSGAGRQTNAIVRTDVGEGALVAA